MIGIIIFAVFWGLVLYVLWWGLGALAPPQPIYKILQVLLILVAVIVALELIMRIAALFGAPVDLGLHIPR